MLEPWLVRLNEGDRNAAWDLFADLYGRLMRATIRRLVSGEDEAAEAYSFVCAGLVADDFARLRRYSPDRARSVKATTWVIAVVRNLTVDWLRQQHGRQRLKVPNSLTPLQQEIHQAICIDGLSHVEAFELIRTRGGNTLSFHEFLTAAQDTQRLAPCPERPVRARPRLLEDEAIADADPAALSELALLLSNALNQQPADVRLAIELFVIEGQPAGEVARVVGWANAKAVYNRVHRTLETLRHELQSKGLEVHDFGE